GGGVGGVVSRVTPEGDRAAVAAPVEAEDDGVEAAVGTAGVEVDEHFGLAVSVQVANRHRMCVRESADPGHEAVLAGEASDRGGECPRSGAGDGDAEI